MSQADPQPAFPADTTHVSGRRFLAHWIDGVLYTVALFATILLADAVLPGSGVDSPVYIVVLILALTVGHAWFLVLLHGSSGRSPGKRATGLRVVDAAGKPPTRAAMWKRSIPAIIEYFYVLAFIGMMASAYRQRFGDRWADTYVVPAE